MSQHLMIVPLVVFWVVLMAGRKELGWKGVILFVALWLAMVLSVQALHLDGHFFIAGESILDIILVSTVYIGFTRLR